MSVSKSRWAYSFGVGKDTEAKFKDLMELRGNTCIKSSTSDDIKYHIDFYVNDIPVDVKGSRHLETIWLEITNVRGEGGWLKGRADYIVFDIMELNSFCFYRRPDLLEFVSSISEVATSKKEYMKLYTRQGRQDVIVKVRHEDIRHLEIQRIPYEQYSRQIF